MVRFLPPATPVDKTRGFAAKPPIYKEKEMLYHQYRKLSNIPPAWAALLGRAAPFYLLWKLPRIDFPCGQCYTIPINPTGGDQL